MPRNNCKEELCLQDTTIIRGDVQADNGSKQKTGVYTLQHLSLPETEQCVRIIDKECIKADDQTEFLLNNGRGRDRLRVIIAIVMMVSGAVLPVLVFFHEPSVPPALPTGAISVLFPVLAAGSVPDAGKEQPLPPHFPAEYTGPGAEAKRSPDGIEPPAPTAVIAVEAVPPITGTPVENAGELHEPGLDGTMIQPDVFVTRFPPAVSAQSAWQSNAVITIHRNNTADRLSEMTEAVYAAYVAGRFQDARQGYLSILKEKHNHRNALLGVAASAQREGDSNLAWWMYQRLLSEYPHDPVATAGMINLSKGRDQEADMIAIGKLLLEQPRAAYLHFTLGSLHADAGRWPEARAAFAEASHLEGNNPDYACNLAVTLDRLGDVEGARSYYGKALELSRYRKPYFDLDEVRSRLASLADTASEHHAR